MKKNITLSFLLLFYLFSLNSFAGKQNIPSNDRDTKLYYIDSAAGTFSFEDKLDRHAFQLISHGRPGQLLLQGKWMNSVEIVNFLKSRLSPDVKYLNIYGCEFGKGAVGFAALQFIQVQLGVHVAASTNVTGQGGDWILELGNNSTVVSFNDYKGCLQTVGGTGSLDDFDGDGVNNLNDIDDDNDGVLDATEATSCYYDVLESLPISKITSPVYSSSVDNQSDGDIQILHDGVTTSVANNFHYDAGGTIGTSSVVLYRIEYLPPNQVWLGNLTIVNAASLGNSLNAVLQASNDTISWTTVSASVNLSTTTSKVFASTATMVYRYYRVLATGTTASSTVSTADVYEITTVDNKTGYIPSLHAKSTCLFDTDGDGKNNNMDLDSDGDGCSDAFEAGATTNTAINYSFPTGAGTDNNGDGLANAVDGGNGTVNYVSTYTQNALNKGYKACGDADVDLVLNKTDLDDDNDGILDVTETICDQCLKYSEASSRVTWTLVSNVLATGTITKDGQVVNITATSTSSAFDGLLGSSWNYLGGGNFYTGCPPNPFQIITNSAIGMYGYNYTVTYTFSKPVKDPALVLSSFNGSNLTVPQHVYVSGTAGTDASVIAQLPPVGTYVRELPLNNNTGEATISIIYPGVYNSISITEPGYDGYAGLTLNINEILPTGSLTFVADSYEPYCKDIDTDADGISNREDTDSDNDGCTDANEYYNIPTGSGTDGGAYGTNPVLVDANGKVTTTASSVTPPSYTGGNYDNAINNAVYTTCCKLTPGLTGTITNLSTCIDTTGGSIKLTGGGIQPNTLYSVSYVKNGGAPTTPSSVTSNASSEIIVGSLSVGVYSNIIVSYAAPVPFGACVTNTGSTTYTLSSPVAPASPNGTSGYYYCGSAAAPTISATPESGATIDWYNAASGGTLLATTTNTYTPTGPGTYYAEARNTTTSCTSTSRLAVSVIQQSVPTVDSIPNQMICNGGNTNPIVFTGSVSGTLYSWTNNNTSIGLAASGTGNIASFAGNTSGTATVTVTPTYSDSTITCTGTSRNFTITVTSIPSVTAPASQIYCNDISTTAIALNGNPVGLSYNITGGSIIGLSDQTGASQVPGFTTLNGSNDTLTQFITITPVLNGCVGSSVNMPVTVLPTLNMSPVLNDITLCNQALLNVPAFVSNASTAAIPLVTYAWTNSTPSVITASNGAAASGNGNISADAKGNNSGGSSCADVSTTYAVTPIYTLNSKVCQGVADSFVVKVHPSPNGVLNYTGEVCVGQESPLTFIASCGTGPWILSIGINTVTSPYSNATVNVSGAAVTGLPIPSVGNTTYDLMIITDGNGCINPAN